MESLLFMNHRSESLCEGDGPFLNLINEVIFGLWQDSEPISNMILVAITCGTDIEERFVCVTQGGLQ